MKNIGLIITLFCGVIIQVCGQDQGMEQDNPPTPKDLQWCEVISRGTDVPFEIRNVYYYDNLLFMDVEYMGGCKEHSFSACAKFVNNNEEMINISVAHDDKGDMCRSTKRTKIVFNLDPLKERVIRPSTIEITNWPQTYPYNN